MFFFFFFFGGGERALACARLLGTPSAAQNTLPPSPLPTQPIPTTPYCKSTTQFDHVLLSVDSHSPCCSFSLLRCLTVFHSII